MGAILITLNFDARRLTALRADQHHVRNIEWSLELDTTRTNRAALSLHLALMLGMHVDALYYHPVLVRQNLDHFATFALVIEFPADNFNGITPKMLTLIVHSSTGLQHFRGQ